MEIPFFFAELLKQKQIPNVSPEDILLLFPINKSEDYYIRLDKYKCICTGKKNGKRSAKLIRILKCSQTPLVRCHEIEMDGNVLQVESLNPFRHKQLLYEDYVNFDRSTFLLLEDKKIVIRLSLIRDRLQLPLFTGELNTPTIPTDQIVLPPPTLQFNLKKKDQIIEYIKNDLLSIYEHIFESSDFETTDDANNYFKDVLLGILEPSINLLFGQDIEKVYQAYIRACTIQERQQEQEIAAEEFKKFLDFLDEDHN